MDGVGVDPVAKDLSGMSTIHAASMGHQLEVVKVGHTHPLTHQVHQLPLSLSLSLSLSLTLPPFLPLSAVVGEQGWS